MRNQNKVKDLTGQRFGQLTVIGIDSARQAKQTYWLCECDCGTIKSVRADGLKSGSVKSCGCLKRKQDRINLTKNHKHKMSGTRIYLTWQGMKGRCLNKNNPRWSRYGGRGITVCNEWETDFQAFYQWAMANGYSDGLTLDRIDNNGNYCPENCRWATQQEQARNRRTNIDITIGNSTRTLMEWCEIFNLDYRKMYARYQRNHDSTLDGFFNV